MNFSRSVLLFGKVLHVTRDLSQIRSLFSTKTLEMWVFGEIGSFSAQGWIFLLGPCISILDVPGLWVGEPRLRQNTFPQPVHYGASGTLALVSPCGFQFLRSKTISPCGVREREASS